MLSLIGVGIWSVASFLGGGVFAYLFLKSNPNKKAEADKILAEIKAKIDEIKKP